jgi:hypothetical protein
MGEGCVELLTLCWVNAWFEEPADYRQPRGTTVQPWSSLSLMQPLDA